MSTLAPARSSRALPTSTIALAWIFAATCAAMAVYTPVFESANWELLGSVLYLVAAGLVAASVMAHGRTSPRLAVGLVTVGALAGALFLVWTLVVPILALALIALLAWSALRGPSVASKAAASEAAG